ncbi:ferrous iron transporter B [bacterium]|nr:MAG: ferrous iron transporter B [bacterium]
MWSKWLLSAIPSKSTFAVTGSACGRARRRDLRSSLPEAAPRTAVVAVLGNPNAGKTTLFNGLTGARQRVGNYPGVTVERVSGLLKQSGRQAELVDIPGLYSLTPISEDERVAVQALQDDKPDLVVCVLDATNLERNLFLFSQLADMGIPTLVALTMVDRLEALGEDIDLPGLSERLGVEIVPVVGHREKGLDELLTAIFRNLDTPKIPVTQEHGEVADRYAWAGEIQTTFIKRKGERLPSFTDKIDAFLTHRVFGLAFFVGVMYLVFQSIYSFATPVMEEIEESFGWLGDKISPLLEGNEALQSFVVKGLIGGVGGMVVFLPQILILFFFIAVLEGTGYLARAAFLMDKLLGWAGLNGRAFIPLLSSFACAIPGIMAARVMPDPKSRLATILVAPLMSCSARLPVYILLIGTFVEPKYGPFWAGFTLFALHFLGLLVAIPIVWFFNRTIVKGKRLPFLLELPPYQWPKWRDVWLSMWYRGRVFLKTAGTIIVAMSLVIWALGYYPRNTVAATDEQTQAERQLENSYLGRMGKTIEPVFLPAGFDWRITTGILSAFPARETIVPTLGIIFALGEDQDEESTDLRSAMDRARWPDGRPLFTPWTAIGLMVFFALCAQCMATLATVKRETNSWKWPVFMFVYMTGLAYVAAVAIHLLGQALG